MTTPPPSEPATVSAPEASQGPSGVTASPRWIAAVFFASGFAALVYQIAWQRALFAIFGINVESVTVIVAAFMLGLGLGSLAGGWVSARRWMSSVRLFGLAELGIGLFGWFSLALFGWVGAQSLPMGPATTGLATFALVLVPTGLMGATLPLLVEHLVAQCGNVGRSVGLLYFVNTLGSAVASVVAAVHLLGTLGLAGSVRAAAVINLLVGLWALASSFGEARR